MKIKSKQRINGAKVNDQESATGMKKWIDEYKKQFLDEKKLKAEIDEYLQNYDESKAKQDQAEKDMTNQPDEEGWVTVTTKSRKANRGALTERNIHKIKSKQHKKEQKMQLVSFYKFQAKDTKKDYIMQLRKKFEEDKNQIEEMRKQRKFKPF